MTGCCLGRILLDDHVAEQQIAALVENPAAQCVCAARQRAHRTIIGGHTTGDCQILKDHMGSLVDNLKDPVMKSAGVDDGRARSRGAGSLDDQQMAGIGYVQVPSGGGPCLSVPAVLDRQVVGARFQENRIGGGTVVGIGGEDGVAQAAAAGAAVQERGGSEHGR
jgi:hypothetical protein